MTPSERSPRRKSPAQPPTITLLTDFGGRDGFVGIVKGVLLRNCPEARLVDLSHDIAPQDVVGGALVLVSAVRHFPRHTVHLAVIDPGVGGPRRPIVVETPDFVLVGPDNGLLSLAAAGAPQWTFYHLDRREYFLEHPSNTFHARDVFAPVAARIAAGVEPARLGTRVDAIEELSLPAPRRVDRAIEGQVIYVDRFGNLVTNLQLEDLAAFRGEEVSVSIRGVQIAGISTHYSAVREGRPVVVWNSWGRLEVAICNGSAARHLRARAGDRIEVTTREPRR
ncbi:MAG: SAM hydrolase/SAM-dependent halogenase family protein [Candidatus Binatia bacterium]